MSRMPGAPQIDINVDAPSMAFRAILRDRLAAERKIAAAE